ncbi:hypothetical protein NQ318_006442 [Aromia moschata]|uniref:Uncharacterized protein n=1 Tax=Aromia moschata TaxID=1265417 RepID=A0AAV8XQY1_9CUCU|nr:hypothetical protein NQ318_006442 [Aromia moschata]
MAVAVTLSLLAIYSLSPSFHRIYLSESNSLLVWLETSTETELFPLRKRYFKVIEIAQSRESKIRVEAAAVNASRNTFYLDLAVVLLNL